MSERNEDSAEYRAAWQRTRDAIMAELASGWLIPGDNASAEAMLDDLACVAAKAALNMDGVCKKVEYMTYGLGEDQSEDPK